MLDKGGQSRVMYVGCGHVLSLVLWWSSRTGQENGNVPCRHLPHGFFETQLKEYFGQFGTVSKVRVARSKRTTGSKGYAFLKFQHAEVARIAAEAMNGYMMFGHTLKCSIVPIERQHPELFKGGGRTMRKKPWLQMEADRHNMQRTPEAQQKRLSRLAAKARRRSAKIKELGIDYDAPELQVARPSRNKFLD